MKYTKKDFKEGLYGALVLGIIYGIFFGLFIGLSGDVIRLLNGLSVWLIVGLFLGTIATVIVRSLYAGLCILFLALVGGLTMGIVSQIIAFITSNPKFLASDFWSQLILVVLIQIIGWSIIRGLKE